MKSKMIKAVFQMSRGGEHYTVSFSKTKGRNYEINVSTDGKVFSFDDCLCPNMTHANDAIDRFNGAGRLAKVKPKLSIFK